MNQSIIKDSEQFIRKLLQNKLSSDHSFHDLQHTLDVREAVLRIADKTGVSAEDREVLELAALFHDVGYTEAYKGHEAVGRRIANDFLREHNYSKERLPKVLICIEATRYEYVPQTELEAIICDADLSNLGSEDYLSKLANLRKEWEVLRKEVYSDRDWLRLNRRFFKQHRYHTPAGFELFASRKEQNLKLMEDPKKQKKKQKDGGVKPKNPLASSKSVQVMFKTALRNHIDLTNLADNKANIMLSINAIIITITIPLLPTYMKKDMILIFPAIVLLSTCIISIIFATLATRPISMKGRTTLEQVRSGKSNLFFFGNFYNMNISEYKEGMKEVINNEKVLEDSAISDLYYLGAALGNKYRLLRTCYTIFMTGMTLTVIAFALAKMVEELL